MLGLNNHTLLNGLFTNYPNCSHIIGDLETLVRISEMVAKSDLFLNDVVRNKSFGMSKYLSLAPIFAFFNFSFGKYDKKQIEMPKKMGALRYERNDCSKIFDEMRYHLPEMSICFQTKLNYRLEFDHVYSIIQPKVKTGFITPKEKQNVINAIFIMIQNGISLCSQAGDKTEKKIEDSNGVSRGVVFEPQFEKYLVYKVKNIIKNSCRILFHRFSSTSGPKSISRTTTQYSSKCSKTKSKIS